MLDRLLTIVIHSNEPFIPPTPADLQHHTTTSDRFPPSQSKRWFDWKVGKSSAAAPPSLVSKTSSGSRSQRGVRAPSPISVTSGNAENRKRTGNARSERQDVTEPPQSAKSISGGNTLKRRPSMNRRASSDSSEDSGPLAGPPTAKKRSTMNSRDAAYEAAIRASLVEKAGGSPVPSSIAPVSAGDKSKNSKRARRSEEDEGSEDANGKKSVRGLKRTRGEDGEAGSDEDASGRKGKKKRDEEGECKSLPLHRVLPDCVLTLPAFQCWRSSTKNKAIPVSRTRQNIPTSIHIGPNLVNRLLFCRSSHSHRHGRSLPQLPKLGSLPMPAQGLGRQSRDQLLLQVQSVHSAGDYQTIYTPSRTCCLRPRPNLSSF